jgi:hypothetical protein
MRLVEVASASRFARWAAIGSAFASALVAAGCTSSTSTHVSDRVDSASGVDAKVALDGLLKLPDFPSGWTSQGSVSKGNVTSGFSATHSTNLASCIGVSSSSIDPRAPHWTGPTFSDSNSAVNVNDEVVVFSNQKEAQRAFAVFANSRTPTCLATLLGSSVQKQVARDLQGAQSVGSVTATVRPFPTVGQGANDIELTVPITSNNQQVPVYVDVIVVRQGRAETTVTASSPVSPFPLPLAKSLAMSAVERMRS